MYPAHIKQQENKFINKVGYVFLRNVAISNLNTSLIFQKTSKYRDILLYKITYVEHIIAYKRIFT